MKHSRFSAGKLATAVFATAIVAAAILGGIASASGNPGGQMYFLGCISAAPPCTTQPSSSLDQPSNVLISSDQSRVFVAATATNTVSILARNRKYGSLSQVGLNGAKGCVSEGGVGGCGTARAMVGPTGLAEVGESLYVASPTSQAVSFIRQDPSSRDWKQPNDLTGCFSEDGTGGTCVNAFGLTGVRSLALYPHSYADLYAGGTNGIAWFERNKSTGVLREERGCINDDGSDGCVNGFVPGTVTDIFVDADGKYLYAAVSGAPGAILIFSLFRGDPTEIGCVNDDGSNGCVNAAAPLVDPQGLQGDERGRSLYVAANGSDTLAAFQRDPLSGALTGNGCFNTAGTGGCTATPGLDDPHRVRVCENAFCVLVTAGDGVASLFRNPKTGILSTPTDPKFIPCFNKTGTGGCTQADGLGGAIGIDSIGGGKKQAYIGGSTDDAVAFFHLR